MLGEEMLVGAVLGLTARLAISALQVAGSVVAQQLGLGFVTAVDPTQNQQGVIVGNFLTVLGITLIFATDLHHLVIAALNDSYKLFAPGEVPLVGDMAQHITRVVTTAFRIGIQLSAPFLVFGLLFNLGLGVLSRLMPQMQVFFIGLPLSILLGLLLLMLVIGAMMGTFVGYMQGVLAAWRRTAEARHGGRTTDHSEKTEDPTQKRLDDALKRGDVVKSQEVSTWFIIAGATLVLVAFSGGMGQGLTTTLRGLIANSYDIRRRPGDAAPVRDARRRTARALALPFLLLMLAALAGNMIQHRLVWSVETLTPKLSKISPAAGFKRLFSKQALANFAKGLVKLRRGRHRAHRGDVAGALTGGGPGVDRHRPRAAAGQDHGAQAVGHGGRHDGGRRRRRLPVPVPAMVRAAEDVAAGIEGGVQADRRRSQDQGQDEAGAAGPHAQAHDRRGAQGGGGHHQPDPLLGRPAIRARHGGAGLRRQGRRRAGAENPRGGRRAPIPIVENAPLARALHATVEVDQAIPPEHYKAVAEVIGYVMKLRRARAPVIIQKGRISRIHRTASCAHGPA